MFPNYQNKKVRWIQLKKIIVFLLLISIGLISYLLINNDSQEETLSLNSYLKLQSENNGVKKFEFSVTSSETKPIKIIFNKINDISIALKRTEGNEENIVQNALTYDIPERNIGDEVTLSPNETLNYPMSVDVNKLTPGKYELVVQFSAENIEVIKQTIDIIVK